MRLFGLSTIASIAAVILVQEDATVMAVNLEHACEPCEEMENA